MAQNATQQNDLLGQLRDLLTNAAGAERAAPLPSIPLPAKYRGRSDKRDFETFLKELYRVKDYYGWNNARHARVLPTLLEGEALSLFSGLTTAVQSDWRALCDFFLTKNSQIPWTSIVCNANCKTVNFKNMSLSTSLQKPFTIWFKKHFPSQEIFQTNNALTLQLTTFGTA